MHSPNILERWTNRIFLHFQTHTRRLWNPLARIEVCYSKTTINCYTISPFEREHFSPVELLAFPWVRPDLTFLSTPCFLSKACCFTTFASVCFIKRLSPTHSSQLLEIYQTNDNIKRSCKYLIGHWIRDKEHESINKQENIQFNLLHVVDAKHLWQHKPQ